MVTLAKTLLLFFLCQNIQAALLLEPRFSRDTGQLSVTNTKTNYTANGYGLDIGYMGDYFLAGLTLDKSLFIFDESFDSNNDDRFDGGGIGTFLGFHFLDRFRLQTTYMNSTLESTSNKNFRYFGQYFSFGLGVRLIDGLMLNYARYNNQYTQQEDDSTGKTSGLSSNIKTTGHVISLSYILVIN